MSIMLSAMSILFAIIVARRTGLVSPTGVVTALFAGNISSFFLIEYIKENADIALVHSYKFSRSYLEGYSDFAIYYFVAMILIASFGIAASKNSRERSKFNPIIITGTQPQIVTTFLFCTLIAYVFVHSVVTEFAFLKPYTTYLALRDPRYFGITNPAFAVMHSVVGVVGVASSLALYIAIKSKRGLLVFIATAVFLYFSAYQAASLSRWLVVQIAIFVALALSDRSLRLHPATLILLILIPAAYFGALNGRSSQTLGIGAFISGIFSGATAEFWIHSLSNVFGGGLVFSEAATRVSTTYPLIFKATSFSPLPSFVDGFSSLKAIHEVRINIYGPFSTYAELYWFGPHWGFLFFLITGASIFVTQRAWDWVTTSSNARILVMASFGLTVYGHLFSHQYPVRSSLRWIVFAGALAIAALLAESAARRRKSPSGSSVTTAVP